ncbi:pentatricopeptide repeat-containing protein At2g13600-like [Phoenix dactylifera]|uniref:Pentatricopeptide repeat-containing protein At2g13600-like n=1 Tax=Phoenix dactylifera TaxID=42345 RepID=A0A8B7C176_PHODC|nr:pentatricopeptide repeat-containing protein At2g13600-like [Phoenix dactylifera]XP_008789586.2 pentatricopeptide repeat-containing protein At2g13600-like [Phoenix dactylifera]XP_008789589.2 pentatricopeptide repeat-containing protein At2g13600-like [Phoenix dactylifera]XP_008789590.2 pentatricopeptide repeat-containing protein At2g13600-like [Phoenix dactylifera]XP_008789593.2 pentatricopeptide repeat-containing protein At2g13600-like [Phoenix dactylifera]XP_008789595.2 pentatricopeptide re
MLRKLSTSLLRSSHRTHAYALLSGHARSRRADDALALLDATPHADARSWNAAVSGLAKSRQPREALTLFVRMTRSPSKPDDFTYATIIPCCDLAVGRQVHAQIVKVCSTSDPFIGTNLVRVYADGGEMGDARKVFDEMLERDSVSWNVLVHCYAKFGARELFMQLFREMVRDGIWLDEFTLAIVLNELTGRLRVLAGMQVHSLMVRHGFCVDRFACNALLNLYSKCGFVASAVRLFNEMPEQDVVSWTAMIAGLLANDHERDALEAFCSMRMAGVEPNSFTFGSLIGFCASTSACERGMQYHALVLKYGLELDVVVGSALVDMYSKCGEMNDALRLFQCLPEKDLVSWNGMICGFAQNGDATKSLQLFDEMTRLHQPSVTPNHITFVGVLSACSHGGFVHEGCSFFNDMVHEYSIEPQAEHYACIVDLLGRAGLLEEAEAVILALPYEPDAVIWGALLGACRGSGNLVMAERIAGRLSMVEPKDSFNYVLLANMYSVNEEWNEALEVREVMCANGAQKLMGSSWIEIRGHVHSFTSGGYVHYPQLEIIFELLQKLQLMMLEERYQTDSIHVQ